MVVRLAVDNLGEERVGRNNRIGSRAHVTGRAAELDLRGVKRHSMRKSPREAQKIRKSKEKQLIPAVLKEKKGSPDAVGST